MFKLDFSSMDRKGFLLVALAVEAVLVLCFSICAFVVADTANAGFNVVLTAILYIIYCGGTYYVIQKSHTPLAIGFLIGVTATFTIVSLETAVYWGQLSGCEKVNEDINQYSCKNKSAYSAVAAFAALLFLVQLVYTVSTIIWRKNLIGETGLYEEIGGAGRSDVSNPYAVPPNSYDPAVPYGDKTDSYNQHATSADL